MASFQTFATWAEVIAHVQAGKETWYHAPMDLLPHSVIARVGKNPWKVRVIPLYSQTDPFFAYSGHLDRFRRMTV